MKVLRHTRAPIQGAEEEEIDRRIHATNVA
jgi:hypothetical protein